MISARRSAVALHVWLRHVLEHASRKLRPTAAVWASLRGSGRQAVDAGEQKALEGGRQDARATARPGASARSRSLENACSSSR